MDDAVAAGQQKVACLWFKKGKGRQWRPKEGWEGGYAHHHQAKHK